MYGSYAIAHLLGVTRDREALFRDAERELTKVGYICFAPAIYDFEVYAKHADMLKDMCREKLFACDLCVLVTPDHVGKSTANRIREAHALNKPVFVWEGHCPLKKRIATEEDLKKYIEASNCRFPIKSDRDSVETVPWLIIEDYEARAVKYLEKSLKELAESGGITWLELFGILFNRDPKSLPHDPDNINYKDACLRVIAEETAKREV